MANGLDQRHGKWRSEKVHRRTNHTKIKIIVSYRLCDHAFKIITAKTLETQTFSDAKKTDHEISAKPLTLKDLAIFRDVNTIKLSDEPKKKRSLCREYLDQKLKDSDQPIYGINTGFGSLYNKNIHMQLEKLRKTWLSHTPAEPAPKYRKKLCG